MTKLEEATAMRHSIRVMQWFYDQNPVKPSLEDRMRTILRADPIGDPSECPHGNGIDERCVECIMEARWKQPLDRAVT